MKDFKIEIHGVRGDDGSGAVAWYFEADDGKQYGDAVRLEEYDAEWYDAVEPIAIQAALAIAAIYSQPDGVDPEMEEHYDPTETF